MKEKGYIVTSLIIIKSDIFDDIDIHCLSRGIPDNAEAIRLRRFKNTVITSMKFSKKLLRFAFISIQTNDH